MKRLEDLPDIAARGLGGLNADVRLRNQIRLTAAEKPARLHVRWQRALACCAVVALCLCASLWAMPAVLRGDHTAEQNSAALLGSKAAGDEGETDADIRVRALDVPAGSISVGGTATDAGSYRNLFTAERNGNFPLILIDGAAYRLLISPTDMDDSLLGDSLGEVTEYTLEPSLSNGGIVSNTVSAGDEIYAVRDMKGAMAAAYVRGSLRVFQRVSFAGTAILGDESLEDTLVSADHVIAMELTGAGIIDDRTTATSLMQTLLSNASYESASEGSSDTRSLLIALDNGLLMQLMVGDDTVSACGTWSCPEFFEAYDTAAQSE